MRYAKLAGIDVGTTGCKITVFYPDGEILCSVYKSYPLRRLRDAHEVNPDDIWQAVKYVIQCAAKEHSGISTIGVSSFGEAFAMLGCNDEVLMPALLNTDPRGEKQCKRLVGQLGADFIVEATGLFPSAMYSLPKLMWIKEHEPDIYAKTRHVLCMQDYIVYRLCGAVQIDYSLAARTMAFDINGLCWNDKILAAAGVNAALLPKAVPSGTFAGFVKRELAGELGLDLNTAVVSACNDQTAAAVGSGVFETNCAVDGAGTVQCNTVVFHSYNAKKMAASNYCIIPHVREGSYVTYSFSYSGGALIKWFSDNLAGYAKIKADEEGKRIYAILEESWAGVPTGILVLPHFAGAATPYMDSGSKGCILGLSFGHTQQDIFVAILEGICYEMLLNKEHLEQAGVNFSRMMATGGGAKSRVWLQMKSNILNVPITLLQTEEAGTVGSAMLAGVATGVFLDIDTAAAAMVRKGDTIYPQKESCEKYAEVYKRYKKLYAAVRPLT